MAMAALPAAARLRERERALARPQPELRRVPPKLRMAVLAQLQQVSQLAVARLDEPVLVLETQQQPELPEPSRASKRALLALQPVLW